MENWFLFYTCPLVWSRGVIYRKSVDLEKIRVYTKIHIFCFRLWVLIKQTSPVFSRFELEHRQQYKHPRPHIADVGTSYRFIHTDRKPLEQAFTCDGTVVINEVWLKLSKVSPSPSIVGPSLGCVLSKPPLGFIPKANLICTARLRIAGLEQFVAFLLLLKWKGLRSQWCWRSWSALCW